VLVNAIGEVLAGHADHATFPVLQVAIARREAKATATTDQGSEGIRRKPFKPAKHAQKASGKNARGKK